MGRNKQKYCYVCRKDSPCDVLAPCNQLNRDDKAKAYRIGYYALHGTKLNVNSRARYWSDEDHVVRRLEREQQKADRLIQADKARVQIEELRERLALERARLAQVKTIKQQITGREAADKEADQPEKG